ncbi:hypothetical protein Hanom_Chr12g01076041 [Helianthus anomalus]
MLFVEQELAMLRQLIGQVQELFDLYDTPPHFLRHPPPTVLQSSSQRQVEFVCCVEIVCFVALIVEFDSDSIALIDVISCYLLCFLFKFDYSAEIEFDYYVEIVCIYMCV